MYTSAAEQLISHYFEIKHYLASFFSFPGGKKDPEDKSAIETAVREMEEEMGLEKSHVQVWAQMPAMPDRVITCFQSKWFKPWSIINSYGVIVQVRVALKRLTSYELITQDSLSQGPTGLFNLSDG